jgi:hypothetical protein
LSGRQNDESIFFTTVRNEIFFTADAPDKQAGSQGLAFWLFSGVIFQ